MAAGPGWEASPRWAVAVPDRAEEDKDLVVPLSEAAAEVAAASEEVGDRRSEAEVKGD